MYWKDELSDYFIDFLADDFSENAAENLLNRLGIGAYELSYAPCSATHLVLVHSKSDYAFSSEDLSWLDCATEVLCYRVSESITVNFVNIDVSSEDYYTYCAAVIKIMNTAFDSKNVFIFKTNNGLAIGSARSFQVNNNDFVVSGLISSENIENYEGLMEGLYGCDLDELPDLLSEYSPQEKADDYYREKTSMHSDYLSFLGEFQSLYGVDMSHEILRFFSPQEDIRHIFTYQTACYELRNVVQNGNISSYEALNLAEEAEKKTQNIQLSDPEIIESSEDEKQMFSDEAFKDAEKMLREMLEKSK